MAKRARRGIIPYKSYSFVDKDPVIDALRTQVSDAKVKYTQLSADSGVSYTTLRNWFHGEVRRPQFATIAAVATALGKRTITITRGKPHFE